MEKGMLFWTIIGVIIALATFIWNIFFPKPLTQVHSGAGDNIAGNKITYETKRFSSIQSLKLWPSGPDGDKDSLNLDNVATLTYIGTKGETGVLLALNVGQIEIPHPSPTNKTIYGSQSVAEVNPNSNFRYEDFSFIEIAQNTPIYEFDMVTQKVNKIKVGDRIFKVSLNKVIKHSILGVSSAPEYEFGISELGN